MGLPLLAAGMPLGALRFSFGKPRTILEEERVFLEALAGQCALAVERAEMYEKEHTAAVTLQRSLLPGELPNVPGLMLDARYLPRSTDVGGDWYDVFRLPGQAARRRGGRRHGQVGAARRRRDGPGCATRCARLALTDPRARPAVLAGLDRLFTATELEEQVTTVSYLVIGPGRPARGEAGNMPTTRRRCCSPPWRHSRCSTARRRSTPLGWASPRRQHAFRLPPGSTAVFYSDGLVENRLRGIDAGLDELVRVAASAPQDVLGAPGRLLQHLLDSMLAGHEQDDDVTVLVMHVPAVQEAGGPAQVHLVGDGTLGQQWGTRR